jgi:hypothetical protein
MTIFYSVSTNGFYDSTINKDIPKDSVEITTQQHQELLNSQSKGKIIQADANGNPTTVDRPTPTIEQLIVIAKEKRNELLQKSDWIELPNSPLNDAKKQKWSIYRQALRDLPAQAGFPNVDFPISPV